MNINLTPEILKDYYDQGLSDSAIGSLYGMTGEGIAYRRKKYGIFLQDKYNFTKEAISQLILTDPDILATDYYSLTQKAFSKKYALSKITWRPILKDRGILLKTEHRKLAYPLLTSTQRTMILGSMLGDGGLTENNYFYESHSIRQSQYFHKKHEILKPFSGKTYPVDDGTGLRFKTAQHPVFKEFYTLFYKKDSSVKQIPISYLRDNWHDHILVYWFLDDGYYDDSTNELSIANKAPDYQLKEFMLFLNEKYNWDFNYFSTSDINRITLSKKFYPDFFNLAIELATPDMYYKIPEQQLTSEMVDQIPDYSEIKPKFYRKASIFTKEKILDKYILELMVSGFPELVLTKKRIKYLMNISKKTEGKALQTLWEYNHPQIYDEARRKWSSIDFVKKIAMSVLLECPRTTGTYVRNIVRKELNIKI
jgi:LAGLIDADG DNA endonuclease family.